MLRGTRCESFPFSRVLKNEMDGQILLLRAILTRNNILKNPKLLIRQGMDVPSCGFV